MRYISYGVILEKVTNIDKGDLIYVISDVLELAKISRLNGEKFDPQIFLQSIMKKVGTEGTILVSTFNWDFCEGKRFDYRHTPGRTGTLGNAALKIMNLQGRSSLYILLRFGGGEGKMKYFR